MTGSLSRGQSALLGLVVLGALLLGGAGLFLVHDRAGWIGTSFRLYVSFADIQGLEVGARVRLQGIDIGEVEAIEPPAQRGEPVRLRLRLAERHRPLVSSDAQVQIASENLFGQKILQVTSGKAAEPVAANAVLAGSAQPELWQSITDSARRLHTLLSEVDDALQAFRAEQQPQTTLRDLADAGKRLGRVLAQAEKTLDQVERGEGSLGKLVKDETLYRDLADSLGQMKSLLNDAQSGQGTLGKLIKNNDVYNELLASLQESRQLVASMRKVSDAMKDLPLVGGYIEDPAKELVRPSFKRERRVYEPGDLFEPETALLTTSGRKYLDAAAAWLNSNKNSRSEIVVIALAAPEAPGDFAKTLTRKQSETVVDYLRSKHQVQSLGFLPWQYRAVKGLGLGTGPSPVSETEVLPPARVEILLFIPAL